jgi:hypothetical protein
MAVALAALAAASGGTAQEPAPKEYPNSFGELYWVPTYEQALRMAEATGRPIFLMGYSLVGDGSTYTKTSDEACRGVF